MSSAPPSKEINWGNVSKNILKGTGEVAGLSSLFFGALKLVDLITQQTKFTDLEFAVAGTAVGAALYLAFWVDGYVRFRPIYNKNTDANNL